MGSTRTVLLSASLLLAAACGAAVRAPPPPARPRPFHPDRVAWSLAVADRPELARPSGGAAGSLEEALISFYGIVDRPRPAEPSKAYAKACLTASRRLAAASSKAAPELRDHLELAGAFLSTRCGSARKALPVLRRVVKRRAGTDEVFYAAQFFWGDALLDMGRTTEAAERYRYVLGELDSPLYPLALYRTAHCHWDTGDHERAREHLGHVVAWAGDREEPAWVVAMRERALREGRDFVE